MLHRNCKKELLLMLHGGLGDQLSMYFGALEIAKASNRELVVSKWTIDQTHVGSPYGLLELIPKEVNVEFSEKYIHRMQMKFFRLLIGSVRPRVNEDTFFRLRIVLDRVFGIINNVVSFDYKVADSSFIIRELDRLKRRKLVKLNCYFPSFADSGELDLNLSLPGLFIRTGTFQENEYAVVHFRVGDIFDTYSARGILGLNYYKQSVERIIDLDPKLRILAVSDNINRAKSLYGDLPLNWIDESEGLDALSVLRILANSKILVTANSGLSFWAGKLGLHINKVFAPAFPTKNDLNTGVPILPLGSNWVLIQNDFI